MDSSLLFKFCALIQAEENINEQQNYTASERLSVFNFLIINIFLFVHIIVNYVLLEAFSPKLT